MASRTQPVTVSIELPSGERAELEITPTHTAQDLVAALIQNGKLPAQDATGASMRYALFDDRTQSELPGNQPLLELGIAAGSELRVKPGARVGAPGR